MQGYYQYRFVHPNHLFERNINSSVLGVNCMVFITASDPTPLWNLWSKGHTWGTLLLTITITIWFLHNASILTFYIDYFRTFWWQRKFWEYQNVINFDTICQYYHKKTRIITSPLLEQSHIIYTSNVTHPVRSYGSTVLLIAGIKAVCIESEKENGLVEFHVFPTPNTNPHLKK